MSESASKFSSIFNQVVRRHRLARQLSQERLSEHAEVDRTYVGLLERGQRSAGLDVAHRLADALGVPFSDLIAETEAEWQQERTPERRPSTAPDGGSTEPRSTGKRGAAPTPRRSKGRRSP